MRVRFTSDITGLTAAPSPKPTGPVGRLLFNVLTMVAEFEST